MVGFCWTASKSPDRRKYSSGGGGRFENGSTSRVDPCETWTTLTREGHPRISLVDGLSSPGLGVERSTDPAARRRQFDGRGNASRYARIAPFSSNAFL